MEDRRTVILDSEVLHAIRLHPDVDDFSLAFGRSEQGLMIELKDTAGLPVQPVDGIRHLMVSVSPEGLRFRWTDIHGNACAREWNPEDSPVEAIERVLADPAGAAIHAVMNASVRESELFSRFKPERRGATEPEPG